MSSWPPVDLILNVCHLLKPPGTRLVLRRPVERSRSASPFIEDDLCMRVRPDRPMQPSVVRAPPWPRCFKVGALRRRLPRSASPQDHLPPRTTRSLLPVRRRLPRVTAPIPLLVAPQTSSKSRADLGLLCASPELAHAVFGLPTIGRPSQVAVVGDLSPTTTTRRPTTVDDAFDSGCAIPSCPCPCPHIHALSNHRDTVTPRMYLVGHPSKVVV